MKKEEYPENWDEISERIKEKAGWKCENCDRKNSPREGYTLTTHHIDGKKKSLDENMLVALCQRCHLVWERVCIIGQLWLFEKPAWIRKRGL